MENAEIEELAKKAAEGCRLVFQDGGFMGDGWYELAGNGLTPLKELLDKYGDEGLAAFNRTIFPFLEEQARKQINLYEEAFKNLLPRVAGAPYDMREIAELQSMGLDTSGLVTTEDYCATEGMRNVYKDFLGSYSKGNPIKVYISASDPYHYQSRFIDWADGRFPRGKIIVLQKPKKEISCD